MGKKAFFKNTISLAKGAVGALCLGLLFAACDFGFNDDSFQNKAAAYFKEMTSTAAISSFEIAPEDSPTDKNGSVCLDYENDGTVVFTLRNPQHYTFTSGTNMTLELAGSPADSPLPLADQVTIAQDPDDATKITVTYPSEFLKANPAGANISPIVTLFHPVSMASFGSYSEVKLASNAKPPVAAGAIAMQTQETPSKWVICFNLPAIGMVKAAHPDLTTVSVNGSEFAATVTQGKVTFPSGSNLKTEDNKPSNLAENQITHLDFEANGQPCYFMTDDVADETERFYTIVITDDAGLSSELEVSTKGLRLSTPNGYAADDTAHQHPYSTDGSQNYSNENDDGSGEMRLYAKAVTDGEAVPYDPSDASIIYEVYTDEACTDLVTFGKIKGTDGVIPVPGGDSYIKAYARKPLYADSKVVKWMSRVVRTAIYIAPASEGGSDSNDGSKANPYLTIQKAVDANGDSLLMTGCEISGFKTGLVVDAGNATLKDSKVTGSAALGVRANAGIISLDGCEISKNGLNPGTLTEVGGVWIESSVSVAIKGGKISGNKAKASGAGIRSRGALALDGVEISGNEVTDTDGFAGGIDVESGSISITGKNQIFGNKAAGAASDLCLPVGIKINVTGSLAGSTIGVSAAFTTSPTIDTPVAFTTNYRVKNAAIKPGKIFKGQPCSDGDTYGIAANSAGEASFAIGGGGADYGADEYEFGFELADSQDEDVTAVYLEKAATVRLKMAPTRAHIGETPVHELYYKGSDKELYADSAFTEPALDIEYSGDRKLYVTASLWLGGSKRATLSPAWNSTGGRFDVTIPAQTAEGDYTVKVEATYLGLAHAVEFPVNISKRAENAAFYIRNLSAAGTYPVAVEGGVGSGYELDGSGIPVPSALVDNGLARVADAIRLHGQSEADLDGVYISLDARGTTNSSDIESYAAGQYFMDCAALSAIYLPDWMEYVVPNLFENCIRLETVELSPNTQWIGNDGFKGCSKLASISLPQDVTGTSSAHHLRGIEAGAFVGCKSGFKITYAGTKEQWGNVVRSSGSWHDGGVETGEDDGSVTCSDGKCGFDYKGAPTNPLEIPLTIEAGDTAVTITYWNKFDDGSVTYKKSDGSEDVIPYNPNGAPMMVGEVASDGYEITLAPGEKVEFYADKKKHGTSYGQGSIECDADCYVYGNIMSLYDSNNFATCVTLDDDASFAGFFAGNTHIKNKAGKPLLLPATTLTTGCYQNMFDGCTNITSAPDLPATTLPIYCYSSMFRGCTKLQSAPDIAATTVSEMCCYCMFNNCTELVTGPVLRAQNLAWECYQQMFQGCEKLTSVTCLANCDFTADEVFACLSSWLDGTAKDATGTLTRASGKDWSGYIPDNWTVTP